MLPRFLTTIALALAALDTASAQTFSLSEGSLVDSCLRNELSMELRGKISVRQNGDPREFPLNAQARHVYLERYLKAGASTADRSARLYKEAEGTITFDGQAMKQTLRPLHELFVAQRRKERMLTYSLKAPLSREEADLTEHFDTLSLPGVLPGKDVEMGGTWKLSPVVVGALCALQGVHEQDVVCKLEKETAGKAEISVSGTVKGIDTGAPVTLLIDARLEFDVVQKRIVSVDWTQDDQRDAGPASPALSAKVHIKLKRSSIPEPTALSDAACVPIMAHPSASLTGISHREEKGRYEMLYPRDWHVVSGADSQQFVLRLVNEHGVFVGQATLSPWKKIDPKNVMPLAAFAQEMSSTPGWHEEKQIEQKQLEAPPGHVIYNVTASGDLDKVKSVQSFYLMVSPDGDQLIVTFSMDPGQVDNFRGRDLELIRSITFPQER